MATLVFNETVTTHLQNTLEGHHKEYFVTVDEPTATVTVAWGRIGFAVNSRTYACEDVAAAYELGAEKISARRANGYVIVTPATAALPSCA